MTTTYEGSHEASRRTARESCAVLLLFFACLRDLRALRVNLRSRRKHDGPAVSTTVPR